MKKILTSLILASGMVLCASQAKAANNYNLTPEIANAYFNIVDGLAEKHDLYLLQACNGIYENGFEKNFWDARLVDFDNNKVPELFFIYDTDYIDGNIENAVNSSEYQVWGWNGSNAYQMVKGKIGYTEGSGAIMQDLDSIFTENGKSYLHFIPYAQDWDYFDDGRGMVTHKFYTVKNGQWVEDKEKELYFAPYATDYGFEYFDATIGGKPVSGDEMLNRIYYVMDNSINVWSDDYEHTKFVNFANEVNIPFKVTSNIETMIVDGQPVELQAYNVGGSNYIRLRDIAAVMKDTQKPFDVQWLFNQIVVVEDTPYSGDKSSAISQSGIATKAIGRIFYMTPNEYLQSLEYDRIMCEWFVESRALKINDENYIKLRDVAKRINFGVDWDSNTKTVIIDSSKNYSA